MSDGGDHEESTPLHEFLQTFTDQLTQLSQELQYLRRTRELDFRGFDSTLKELKNQQTSTDQRFTEQRKYVEQHFTEQRAYMEGSLQELKAQQANRGATHIYSRIQPVYRFDGGKCKPLPDGYPGHVHELLRLLQPSKMVVLARILRYYDTTSWCSWGLSSTPSDDESDIEEKLVPDHSTLEKAITFAPEIAVQEVASYLGVDYDRVQINRNEDERLQQERMLRAKRALVHTDGTEEAVRVGKRKKQGEMKVPGHTIQTQRMQQAASTTMRPATPPEPSPDEFIGWDGRPKSQQTPSSGNFRARDVGRPNLSPTSVTSPAAQLPTRKKA